MPGERIPALAWYLAGVAIPHIAVACEKGKENPERDLPGLIDQAREAAAEQLSTRVLRALMGANDELALESFVASATLCNEAVIAALRKCMTGKTPRSAEARSLAIRFHANAYISRWSLERGMSLEEVQRLKARGGVS